MTNLKICDKCKKNIDKGKDYIKLTKIIHKGKQLSYIGIGHLCLKCLLNFKEDNKY